MADSCPICLLGAMDRLWFHQIILSPEPSSTLLPKTLENSLAISHSLTSLTSTCCPSTTASQSSIPNEEIISVSPPQELEIEMKERPTTLNHAAGKSRSYSSSPSTQKSSRKLWYSDTVTRLQKTMSCKNLFELELEEVKGFLDLGFVFKKDDLTPRMMSVIPGLQRLEGHGNKANDLFHIDADELDKDDETKGREEQVKEGGVSAITRPYLSEAWLIKRPDSPLLNLRLPRDCTAADMKKHLKYWARIVASEIHQQS